jgi:hypothetical protein
MGIETIQLRIDDVTRRTIETAARLSGKSLSAFIVSAAKAHAGEVESTDLDEERGAALAAYYRARRFESLERQNWETANPGYVATDTVANSLAWDIGESEWLDEIDRLISAFDGNAGESQPPDSVALKSKSEQERPKAPLGVRRNHRKSVDNIYLFNPIPGRVTDLCASGLGVETRDALPLAKHDFFSIGDDAMVRAKIRAEVRWCRLARTESLSNGDVVSIYRSGVEFLEAQPLEQSSR